MAYRCKRCGCPEVYHSCAAFLSKKQQAPVPICIALPLDTRTTGQQPIADTPCETMQDKHVHLETQNVQPMHDAPICDTADVPNEPPKQSSTPPRSHINACERCDAGEARRIRGFKWCYVRQSIARVRGDRLCRTCRRAFCDTLEEFIPMPPSKPGCFLIARTRHLKRVSRPDAITLLCVAGQLLKAAALNEKTTKTVDRRSLV